MELTPREKDKLMLFSAALLAERRLARGCKLNYPEAIAYLSLAIIEGARDGASVAELMARGQELLTPDQLMDGVVALLDEVQVEATFPDGTKLVTVHQPVGPPPADEYAPGAIDCMDGTVTLNEGRETLTVTVSNTGDRPIQVGSHYHFFETNPALEFDRDATRGWRLNIAAGTAVRFEPGQSRDVELVPYGGARNVYGFRGAVQGPLDTTEAN